MIERQVYERDAPFRTFAETLHYQTARAPEFLDITDDILDVVTQSGIVNGIVVIFSRHTTAAVKINECEPELLKDMERFLRELAPIEGEYHHNNFDVRTVNMEEDECPNAHSHCQHLLLNAGESIPIIAGTVQLGRWQRIFLVELDRAKSRQVTVQILGV